MERPADTTKSPARPKVVFIITEDWFFVSHFLPMARAARDAGFVRQRAPADGADFVHLSKLFSLFLR